jgi:hypothetical protein
MGLYRVLQDLGSRDWQGRGTQPWLNPPPSTRRTNTVAAQTGMRASETGAVRSVRASDLGVVTECERRFAATYAGVVIPNTREKMELNYSRGGTMFHKYIERMLPNAIETERTNKWDMLVSLPSIGQRTQKEITGKKRDGILGMMDGYIPSFQTGLELKSVPQDQEFPDDVPYKALGQAAGYAWGLNHAYRSTKRPVRWVWLYLPLDMRTFNAEDKNTYRVFIKDYEELEPIFENILDKATNVAKLVDAHGLYGAWDMLACNGGETCFCTN